MSNSILLGTCDRLSARISARQCLINRDRGVFQCGGCGGLGTLEHVERGILSYPPPQEVLQKPTQIIPKIIPAPPVLDESPPKCVPLDIDAEVEEPRRRPANIPHLACRIFLGNKTSVKVVWTGARR